MTTPFAELVLSARTDGLKAAPRDLAAITKAGAATESGVKKAMKGIEGAVGTVTPATRGAAAAMLDLRKSLDPVYAASKQYEAAAKQVASAVKLGAASQAEANQILALAEKRYLGVGAAANASNTAVGAASKGMNSFAFQSRMAAMQLSQVAQQTMAGGGFIRALSIQLPDLALGFGAVGIAAGVAAGVVLPLVADFFRGSEAVKSFDDALSDANDSITEYTKLLSQAGRLGEKSFDAVISKIETTSQAFKDLIAISKIEAHQNIDALNKSLTESVLSASLLKTSMADTGDLLNIETTLRGNITVWKENRAQVDGFIGQLKQLEGAVGLDDQYEAALSLRDAFKSNVDVSGDLSKAQLSFWKSLSQSIQQMEILGAATAGATSEASSLTKSLDSVTIATYAAIPALDELQVKYGAAATSMRDVLQAQNEIAEMDASAGLMGLAESATKVADKLKISSDAAAELYLTIYDLTAADGIAAQGRAAADLAQEIYEATGGLGGMDVATREVYQSLLDAALGASEVGHQISLASANATALGAAIASIAPQFAPAIGAANNLARALGGVLGQLGGIAKGLAAMSPIGAAVAGSMGALGSAFKSIKTSGLSAASTALAGVGKNLKSVWNEATKADATVASLSEHLSDKFKPAATSAGRAAGGAGGLDKSLRAAEREARKLKEAMDRPLLTVLDGAASAFGDFVSGQIASFKDLGKAILKSIQSAISQAVAFAIANPIKASFGLSGAVTGAAAAGQPAGGGGILGGVFSKALGGFGNTGSILGLGGLGGGSGLLGGLGNAISGGIGNILSVGANAAAAGGGFLASVGAAIPVLGIAAAAFSFFKKKVELLDGGLRITTEGMDSLIDSFKTEKITRFFGLSKKVKTSFEALDAEAADPLRKIIGEIQSGVVGTASALGIASSAFDAFSSEITVSTKDMNDEQAQAAVTAALQGFGDEFAGMVPGLAALQREGEGAYVALQRLVGDLNAMNEATYLMRDSVADMSLASAAAASDLITLSGGLEAFSTKSTFVFANMLTDTAQELRLTEIASEKLNGTLGALGIAIPETHAEFMAMLNAQDLMTEGGRNTHAALLDVASAFTQVHGTAQQAADAIAAQSAAAAQAAQNARAADVSVGLDVAKARADAANAAMADADAMLRAAFAAERQRLQGAQTTSIDTSSISARVGLFNTIRDALERAYTDRRVLTAIGQKMQLADATAFLRSAVSSGGTSDVDRLEAALDAVADPSTALFKSFADYQHDYNVNTNLIERLKGLTDDSLSVEEKTLNSLESQSSILQSNNASQLAALDAQMNALLGIDNSVLSLGDAIAGFQSAKSAVAKAVDVAAPASTQFAAGSFGAKLNAIYMAELGRGVKQAGLDFYGGHYVNGLSLEDIQRDIMGSAEAAQYAATGIPAFASGGYHGGGVRLVGENGPELEVTGPSRIYSAPQTRNMMNSGNDNRDVVAALNETNARLRSLQKEVNSMARISRDQNVNGTPGTRTGAVVATQEVV